MKKTYEKLTVGIEEISDLITTSPEVDTGRFPLSTEDDASSASVTNYSAFNLK